MLIIVEAEWWHVRLVVLFSLLFHTLACFSNKLENNGDITFFSLAMCLCGVCGVHLMCTHVEARGECQVPSPLFFQAAFLRQSLSLNSELPCFSHTSEPQRFSCVCSTQDCSCRCAQPCPAFYVRAGDWTRDLSVLMHSYPLSHLPQPQRTSLKSTYLWSYCSMMV